MDHAGLRLDFASALGTDRRFVTSAAPSPETAACVNAFARSTKEASLALGMLYGYESQRPEVARTKVEGLTNIYEVPQSGTRYFQVHAELDVEHADELAAAIDDIAGGTGRCSQALDGA